MLSSPSNGNNENSGDKWASGTKDRENRDQQEEDEDGLVEADDDYEEYFFRDHGEGDQYVKLVGETPINPAGSF